MCGHFDAQYPGKELESCAQREPSRLPSPGLCVRSVNTAGPAHSASEDSDSHNLNTADLNYLCANACVSYFIFDNHYSFGSTMVPPCLNCQLVSSKDIAGKSA
ncbi:hypothetical protein XENOCAPTIV_020554 [Xenoophorus captivus]|uniref:Uncharacterized protein n=1 Tax=Xenoophorus captivus TaxID=1517983 RepID=A0ABV0RCW7_9TELE